MSTKTKSHPVWDVYDAFRDASYFSRAYTHAIKRQRRVDLGFKIALALFTPGSAIASYFPDFFGDVAWKVLLAIAATLSVIHPLLSLQHRIEKLENDRSTVRQWFSELDLLCKQIKHRQSYDDDLQSAFLEISQRYGSDLADRRTLSLSITRRKQLQSDVRRRHPTDSFFIPPNS